MRLSKLLLTSSVIAIIVVACGDPVAVQDGTIELQSLGVTQSDISLGQPLVVVGHTKDDSSRPHALSVTTSSGKALEQSFQAPCAEGLPYACLSDHELAGLVAEAPDNRVMIGFKEADSERGVDDRGRGTTSDEAIARAKAWLTSHDIDIADEWTTQPGVDAIMAPNAELISMVRNHDNIDYLEPIALGTWDSVEGASFGWIAVIPTAREGTAPLDVAEGDVITIEYKQPDGSRLETTARVR